MAQAVEALDNLIREGRSKVVAKRNIFRAILKHGKKARETRKKKRYLEHFKKAGPKNAMTYVEWMKKGESPVYFKGIKKKSAEARMREAGLTLNERNRFK